MEKLTNSTIKAGVIGWPVSHSLSPKLHGYWLKKYGINGEYHALPIKPALLGEGLDALKAQGFYGANLTVPHKELVLDYVDKIDSLATQVGAVNMILFTPEETIGYNTDVYGFAENIRPQLKEKKTALVLGAGGAAKAVVVALKQLGFSRIIVSNCTQDKAEHLAKKHDLTVVAWQEKHLALKGIDLLVNTTTLGMSGQPPLELSLAYLPPHALVADIVYSPLITPLLAAARAQGNAICDGLGMLLHQAVPAFEAWFGTRPVVDEAVREYVLA